MMLILGVVGVFTLVIAHVVRHVTVVLGAGSKTTCPKGGHDLQSWERQNKRLVQRSGRDWGVGVRAARLRPKYGPSYALSSLSFFVCLLVPPISWLIYCL